MYKLEFGMAAIQTDAELGLTNLGFESAVQRVRTGFETGLQLARARSIENQVNVPPNTQGFRQASAAACPTTV